MKAKSLDIVIIGLTITSSWGNGHATTYRSLVEALTEAGHRVLFLERDRPWYAENRDLPEPPYGRTELYRSLEELENRFTANVRDADMVVIGSYVPEGVAIGNWVKRIAGNVTAFYDIDTPVTLAKLQKQDFEYLTPDLIPKYDLYLSFTGGPMLARLEHEYGSPMARALYCAVNPEVYFPCDSTTTHDLGYMGTYSIDRQRPLTRLMLQPAAHWPEGRFVVAGAQYPKTIRWPNNVERTEHLPPEHHCSFYNSQRFTLNVTRADMVRAGYSPSIRLFEAAACGTPIISDYWEGLESFFIPGLEILISETAQDTLHFLQDMPDEERLLIGERARMRVLSQHTSAQRAEEFELYAREALEQKAKKAKSRAAKSSAAQKTKAQRNDLR